MGRFISADGQFNKNANGLNVFAYCGNNPIMSVDRDGKDFGSWLNSKWKKIKEVFSPVVSAIKNNNIVGITITRQVEGSSDLAVNRIYNLLPYRSIKSFGKSRVTNLTTPKTRPINININLPLNDIIGSSISISGDSKSSYGGVNIGLSNSGVFKGKHGSGKDIEDSISFDLQNKFGFNMMRTSLVTEGDMISSDSSGHGINITSTWILLIGLSAAGAAYIDLLRNGMPQGTLREN